MPSARIHEAIAKEINVDYNFDELLLRIGTVAPDCWRNADYESTEVGKQVTHFWDYKIKTGQANGYEEFYLKYYNYLDNPFYFGYLIHLIVDQYWKTYIDSKYETEENGVKGYRLKNGKFHNKENHWGYFDSLKMQKQVARLYNLGKFPINKEDIPNFDCDIDELKLDGLFGINGTLNYINTDIMPSSEDEESEIYDINDIILYIKETTEFVKKELKKLKDYKEQIDKKIKIAIDIDDTILCTKEKEEFYWKEFLKDNPNINPNRKYVWGDPELALFWKIYRKKMAFGAVKLGVSSALEIFFKNGYYIDLLSARPLDKYASLKEELVNYFETNDIKYNHMHLGFHSKKKFLKEHGYDILIDNDIQHIKEAEEVGITPILFGFNSDYSGYQTDDWSKIPYIIEEIINNKKTLRK